MATASIAIDWTGFTYWHSIEMWSNYVKCQGRSSESVQLEIDHINSGLTLGPITLLSASVRVQSYHTTILLFTMEVISDNQMLDSFRMLDKKFRRACHHIRMLNRRIEDVQVRYDRAFSSGRRSFRYTHRLKLATYEGMRNMYYEYACRRADELEKMQDSLIQRGMISGSDSESDADMDY